MFVLSKYIYMCDSNMECLNLKIVQIPWLVGTYIYYLGEQ